MTKPVTASYRWFKRRSRKVKIGTLVLIGAVIVGLILFASAGTTAVTETPLPAVSLAPVDVVSGGARAGDVFGTVRSVTEATIYSESGGAVRAVHTTLGKSVPAGFILAELENASERAAVLSAEGAYEAALASRASLGVDVGSSVQNAYRNAFVSLDTVLENHVDLFFGNPTSYGPKLLITAPGSLYQTLPTMRRELTSRMNLWREHLADSNGRSPESLLAEADETVSDASVLLIDLARAANDRDSGASSAQLSALATARASVDALQTALSVARNNYDAQKSGGGEISASDAAVKQALGALRAAQASLEKTLVRAPIGGTVNFLSIRPGDFVSAFTQVATVSQNGALEIVAYVSEDTRSFLVVGERVLVDGTYPAVITAIAPALNPVTKQVEVRFAVEGTQNASALVNGASVRVTLPLKTDEVAQGPLMLPLAAVKLEPGRRVVFTVSDDNRLSAIPVETGEVRGSRIEILTELPGDLLIVTDARGRADGEEVRITGAQE